MVILSSHSPGRACGQDCHDPRGSAIPDVIARREPRESLDRDPEIGAAVADEGEGLIAAGALRRVDPARVDQVGAAVDILARAMPALPFGSSQTYPGKSMPKGGSRQHGRSVKDMFMVPIAPPAEASTPQRPPCSKWGRAQPALPVCVSR